MDGPAFQAGHVPSGGGGGGSSGLVTGGVQRITAGGTFSLGSTVSLVTVDGPDGDVVLNLPAANLHGGRHVWIRRVLTVHQLSVVAPSSPDVSSSALDADGAAMHLASDGIVWLNL